MASMIPWKRDREAEPPAPLSRFRTEMDRLFDRFFEPFGGMERDLGPAGQWLPAVDLKDNDKELTVCAELPGMKPEDIDISLSGNTLQISGERREESEDSRAGYYRRERRFGSFARSIDLPPEADADRMTAEYRDGELIVHIPKSEERRPRKIPVQGAGRSAGQTQARPGGEPSAGTGQGNRPSPQGPGRR